MGVSPTRMTWALALLAAVLFGRTADGVTIEVGSTSATPGSSVEIVVAMSVAPNEQVAGLQNDIVFDSSVLAPGRCRINPSIGPGSSVDKTLSTNVLRGGTTLRALVFSTGNVNSIPAGPLYACLFTVREDAPATSAGLQNSNIVASSPTGQKLPVSGASGSIEISGGAGASAPGSRPRPAAAPRAAQQPAAQPGVPGGAVLPTPPSQVPAAPAVPAEPLGRALDAREATDDAEEILPDELPAAVESVGAAKTATRTATRAARSMTPTAARTPHATGTQGVTPSVAATGSPQSTPGSESPAPAAKAATATAKPSPAGHGK
jgi:hypothetical protein